MMTRLTSRELETFPKSREVVGPRCYRCRAVHYTGRIFCKECAELFAACRISLRQLIRERYLVQVGEHAWIIKPGAQEIVQLIYEAVDRFERSEGCDAQVA